ncbi:hypothetical protein QO021_28235 (plasmid) [Pseudomonas amygdali pv. lachrymans]|uniref:hypothetical protein n=1 Tax=Pseudomonas amygdali TaxID=47877 RepID=UPI0006CD5D49|nr:hypothetical protein [Pseudomonas amygdali]KPC01966.1 Uncharacterized protein AC501_3252 [Pseudomonas amygdali pv. lachrymans]RMM39299.1 hypothetical protein ALQ79_200623 [Pseudomonas amygdali pv. lachrymans]WIO61449.1 hypothetical protein QO021_28235 [Pseudomonas amygdali pv. lachrymans]
MLKARMTLAATVLVLLVFGSAALWGNTPRDLLNLAIVLGTPVLVLWLILSRRPGAKIMCMLGRHDLQIAHGHPDGKLGYCIHECTGCSKAVVSDPSSGGSHPIINTPAAIERDASIATPSNQN